MRSIRFTIASLMTVVLILALGLAALVYPAGFWAGLMPLLVRAVLCMAVVGAICRKGEERAWWLGFALLGWSYVGLPFGLYSYLPPLATHSFLEALAPAIGVNIKRNVGDPGNLEGQSYFLVGRYLWALVAAVVGGFLGRAIFGTAPGDPVESGPGSRPGFQSGRNWWVLPSAIVLSGAGLIAAGTLAAAKFEHGIWAGLCYLLTWWLIGLTALGALIGRGRRREFWLGASFFGAGFMILVFARPPYDEHNPETFIPTVGFLEAIRPRLESALSRPHADTASAAASNVKIQKALEEPVTMSFAHPTPLEHVIAYVKDATRSPDGATIPVFVDPIGLHAVERTMSSNITHVELEGVPLRTSLRLCLRQLNLDYSVRDGVLLITSAASLSAKAPIGEDQFQIAGHCLIAVIAAALGGLAAPVVCDLAKA